MTLVREMMPSLHWGMTRSGSLAHMLANVADGDAWNWTYCGVLVRGWQAHQISDLEVCKRCLKITEKYA